MEAIVAAPSACPMVLRWGPNRSMLPHQLHPAAALVHREIAVVRGLHEFVPGDHLELFAAALREAERARAHDLARLEAFHGCDLPRVLERDFAECRHVPSLSTRFLWRRADGRTTMSIYVSFVCLTLCQWLPC